MFAERPAGFLLRSRRLKVVAPSSVVAMPFVSLLLAWVATFSKHIVLQPIKALIKDHPSLVRAHIDLLLMSLLLIGFRSLSPRAG